MMKYDKTQLNKYAAQNGFIRDTYEKMCRQSEILSYIFNDNLLANTLALKGGTAINIAFFNVPRLSLDLDLDLTKGVPKEELPAIKGQISEHINRIMENLGYVFNKQHSKDTHALCSMVFDYKNAGGNNDRLKIETNYMLRQHLLPTQNYSTIGLEGFASSVINCVNPIEIYSTKIVALSTRAAARDMFDVHHMIKSNLFDANSVELLRKCAIFYAVLNNEHSFNKFDFSNLNDNLTISKVKQMLFPILHQPIGNYDLELVKSEINQFAENHLQFTEKETEFINSFFKGSCQPDLLELPQDVTANMSNHYMAEWKLKNINKNLMLNKSPKKHQEYDER